MCSVLSFCRDRCSVSERCSACSQACLAGRMLQACQASVTCTSRSDSVDVNHCVITRLDLNVIKREVGQSTPALPPFLGFLAAMMAMKAAAHQQSGRLHLQAPDAFAVLGMQCCWQWDGWLTVQKQMMVRKPAREACVMLIHRLRGHR